MIDQKLNGVIFTIVFLILSGSGYLFLFPSGNLKIEPCYFPLYLVGKSWCFDYYINIFFHGTIVKFVPSFESLTEVSRLD